MSRRFRGGAADCNCERTGHRSRQVATLAFTFWLTAALTFAQPEFDAAQRLLDAKKYPEAVDAFERILATTPNHAGACHSLGLALKVRNDPAAFDAALKWLAKAAALEPNNPIYLADFGGTSLQLAAKTNSLSAATKGRDAMEKAVALKPDYLDAREGLVQFYERAPWPIGSSAKAAAHLAEIRRRDPERATVLTVLIKTNAKDFPAAFKLCEEVLARQPDNYAALYHYGRAAAMSGQNLERGLARLQKCLTNEPPTPASPTHSNVWQRIGNVQEQLKHPAEARVAYETALKLDPGNLQASAALAKLK